MSSLDKNADSSPLFRHRQLTPAGTIRVSPLCLGTMTFGGKQGGHQGGNFNDTASGYQEGESEMIVGEWMASRENRDEIVLATKYTAAYMTHRKVRIPSNYGGNNAKSMKVSVDASLRKMQTFYIDLLYVHWWDYTTSIPELMHALNDLVVAGKVIYLGISDTPAWVVTKANQYARDHGLRQFSVYQGMWNAEMRDFERDVIPMARDERMALCPYGVLNQGRFQAREGFQERETHNPGRKFIPTSDHDRKVSAVLERISHARGVKLLDVALAYGSIASLSLALTEDEVEEVERAYPFVFGFPYTFLSGSMFDRSTPRMADKPGDVWLTKPLGKFDWVEPPKPIKPSP
ncbi:sterigmatocystin biosynthesis dehydrogenase stcV [Aspergillus affinis]|uniref:sterigmatocystin biosynthesis dehydrogenase stcV n=1 Tax=Aspergillus affinis TaxID=1070780 RepID=UPI0022FE3762|nr:sterigmatocystin biosynthesis dehydrogenase stcV [Aspergillus affinis]KAI9040530.1 sterigmatocystin biosynthesis dehydrogenase stcV [Aspergillus affinis]